MKRKTILLVCSLLIVIAVLVTSCGQATTVTLTNTTTVPGGTVTVTSTAAGQATTQTVTNTVTGPAVTIISTTVVTGAAGQVVTITSTLPGQNVTNTVTVTATGSGTGPITVMNPQIAPTMVQRVPLSPRLSTVDGKKILFVDLSWGGPDGTPQFFKTLKTWFAANHPTTTLEYRLKAGSYGMDDKVTWQLVKDSYDAMIVGISG